MAVSINWGSLKRSVGLLETDLGLILSRKYMADSS